MTTRIKNGKLILCNKISEKEYLYFSGEKIVDIL